MLRNIVRVQTAAEARLLDSLLECGRFMRHKNTPVGHCSPRRTVNAVALITTKAAPIKMYNILQPVTSRNMLYVDLKHFGDRVIIFQGRGKYIRIRIPCFLNAWILGFSRKDKIQMYKIASY